MMEAIKHSAFALEYASERLRSDKEIGLIAMQMNGDMIKFLNNDIKYDLEIV